MLFRFLGEVMVTLSIDSGSNYLKHTKHVYVELPRNVLVVSSGMFFCRHSQIRASKQTDKDALRRIGIKISSAFFTACGLRYIVYIYTPIGQLTLRGGSGEGGEFA